MKAHLGVELAELPHGRLWNPRKGLKVVAVALTLPVALRHVEPEKGIERL